MNLEEIKKIIAVLGLLALAGCSGQGATNEGRGGLAVTILNSKSFNPAIEHGRIQTYRVHIEGDGISEPIVAEFSGDAEDGLIEGVPSGGGRTVRVEGVNENSVTIRAGEEYDVEIGDGENEVDVTLEAVPIFTNLTNDSSVDNTRLVFRLFSEPGSPLEITESNDDVQQVLPDVSTNLNQVWLDEATGTGAMRPPVLLPGERAFTVRDAVSGRSSTVTVKILDGSKRIPAPLAAVAGATEHMVFKTGEAVLFR